MATQTLQEISSILDPNNRVSKVINALTLETQTVTQIQIKSRIPAHTTVSQILRQLKNMNIAIRSHREGKNVYYKKSNVGGMLQASAKEFVHEVNRIIHDKELMYEEAEA